MITQYFISATMFFGRRGNHMSLRAGYVPKPVPNVTWEYMGVTEVKPHDVPAG